MKLNPISPSDNPMEQLLYCFGGDDDGGNGGSSGGSTHPGRPGGESGERGNRSDRGDGNDRNAGDDERDSNDNDGDGIPNSIDATPGTPSTGDDAFSSVGASYDEAVASIAAGEDAFGPGGAAGRDDDGDDGGNDRDNDGIPDTIDIDAGTGTGTPLDGVDIFDPGFDDTAPSIAAPEIALPSVASDVTVGRQQPIAPPPSIRGQVTSVDPQAIADVQARNAISGVTGMGQPTTGMGQPTTVGESLVDSLFSDLVETPETLDFALPDYAPLTTSDIVREGYRSSSAPGSIAEAQARNALSGVTDITSGQQTGTVARSSALGPADITITGGTPDFSFTRDVLGVDQSIPQMSLAPEDRISRFDRQARMGEVAGPMSMAQVDQTRFSGVDMMRQADDVLDARAREEAIFGDPSEMPSMAVRAGMEIINSLESTFGANQARKIADVAARPGGAVIRDPQTGEVLGAVGPEENLESAILGASDAVYVGDPRGYEQGVEIGKSILGPDTNVRDVPTQDPFTGEFEAKPDETYFQDTTTAPETGDGGGVAAPMPMDQVSPECPEGFEYDPVTDSCVPKERAPRGYRGPSTVDIAVPTLTQYTQMAAPRPAALGPTPIPRQRANITPVQLVAPRPIDPLTGRPFRDGGIVNVAKFADGGKVSVAKFADGGKVTFSDVAYLQGLVQAGDRSVSDLISAIRGYAGMSTSELPESVQTALKVREQLKPIEADVFEKYGFDRSQYDKFMNRGMKGIGEDRSFATNSYFVYNPTNNQQMVSNTDGMTIENADAMRSLLRVMDQYNSSTGGAYGSDKQNIRLNFTSGDKFDLLVDGRKLGNFSGSSEGMQDAADSMVSYLSGAYAAPELSQVYQAKQQMQSLPTYEGQSAYKDLAQQTLQSIVGLSDTQDWMDINKDDQVNISDAVKLLKYGAGVEEVPDDIFMLTPQGQIASLEDKYGQLENTYNTLTTDYGAVTGSMRDLEEQLATQTQQTEALQNQLTGMEGYVDPSQFEGYIDPETYAQATGQISDLQTQLSGLEGYIDPETYGNLQTQLDQKIADYNTLNTTYGTTQADLDKAANEISQLQSQLSDLTGQKQQAQQMAEQRRVQGLVQQYGQPTDYTQFAPPAQSFMPQAAQTSRPTQYAPPAGIAGLQTSLTPTVLPALDMPQFTPQPALDIPLLELAQLDPLAPVPYAPPSLYNPFVPPSQNFGS